MISLGGIVAKERWDGYEKGRDGSGPVISKEYEVATAEADAFVDAIMGGVTSEDPENGIITRTGRHRCPENPNLVATAAKWNGLGESNPTGGSTPEFACAVVKVTYGSVSWDEPGAVAPDPAHSLPNEAKPGQAHTYAVMEFDFGDEYVTVPGSSLKFSSDNKVVNAPIGVHVARCSIRYTRKFVPFLPHALIMRTMNGINDAKLFGQDRGKIRFADAKTVREFMSDGTRAQEVTLMFEFREYDWNKYLRPDGYSFDTVVDDSGNKPYTYRNLLELLK